jgi:hypothetical protein
MHSILILFIYRFSTTLFRMRCALTLKYDFPFLDLWRRSLLGPQPVHYSLRVRVTVSGFSPLPSPLTGILTYHHPHSNILTHTTFRAQKRGILSWLSSYCKYGWTVSPEEKKRKTNIFSYSYMPFDRRQKELSFEGEGNGENPLHSPSCTLTYPKLWAGRGQSHGIQKDWKIHWPLFRIFRFINLLQEKCRQQ